MEDDYFARLAESERSFLRYVYFMIVLMVLIVLIGIF